MEEKNPFSLYDFLGYLFPGIFAIFLMFIVRQSIVNPNYTFFDCLHIHNIVKIVHSEAKFDWLETSIGVIVFSYIIGHIISYLSSMTIEYFSSITYDYPSFYLLNKNKNTPWKNFSNYAGTAYKPIVRYCVALVIWPISIPVLISGGLRNYVQRPLPVYLIDAIQEKTEKLYKHLNIKVDHENEEELKDFHRVIMHYVYSSVSCHQNKADNYVALYGFLRSICFVIVVFYDIIILNALYTIRYIFINFSSVSIDWFIIFTVIVGYFLSIVLFLAFTKFYRKFTLENFMTLLTCVFDEKEIEKDSKSKTVIGVLRNMFSEAHI